MDKCLSFSVQELAKKTGAEIRGDGNVTINRIASLESADSGDLSYLCHSRYRKYLTTTKASAVILKNEDATNCRATMLVVDHPEAAYAKIAALFDLRRYPKAGIHHTAVIDDGCIIDETASIGAYCVIGRNVRIGQSTIIMPGTIIGDDCEIGDDCILYSRITLYHEVTIGHRVIIHSGVVIGADGFGMTMDQGRWRKIPQLGRVKIGSDVEIGANSTISRGAITDTVVEDGVKMDMHVPIGHNVRVGAHTVMAGGSGAAGSAKIGEYCMIGGRVAIGDHIEIAPHSAFTGTTMVNKSVEIPGVYSSGTGLMPNKLWRKTVARIHQLDELARRVKQLEKSCVDCE